MSARLSPRESTSATKEAEISQLPDEASEISLAERFRSCLVLSAVGDAFGSMFKEIKSTAVIQSGLEDMGGISSQQITNYRCSDGTILLRAACRTLVEVSPSVTDPDELLKLILAKYSEDYMLVKDRVPDLQLWVGLSQCMSASSPSGCKYSDLAITGGCCQSSLALGLILNGEDNRKLLIQLSVELGRMTHNHLFGFLGSTMTAVFTAFCVEGLAPAQWCAEFYSKILPRVLKYLKKRGRDMDKIEPQVAEVNELLVRYMTMRDLYPSAPGKVPIVYRPFDRIELDNLIQEMNLTPEHCSTGIECCLVAYDAILGCEGWNDMLLRAAFHSGASNTSGALASGWFGALYGGISVKKGAEGSIPPSHILGLEFKSDLESSAIALLKKRAVFRKYVDYEADDGRS